MHNRIMEMHCESKPTSDAGHLTRLARQSRRFASLVTRLLGAFEAALMVQVLGWWWHLHRSAAVAWLG